MNQPALTKRRETSVVLSWVVLLFMTLGCTSATVADSEPATGPEQAVTQGIQQLAQARPSAGALRQTRADFVALAKDLQPSVVNIKVVKQESGLRGAGHPHDLFEDFFRHRMQPREREVTGQGSGVIISEDGYILTNHHVVGGAKDIDVTLWDQTEVQAKLVGSDSKTDLALIKIDRKNLPAARMGDSQATQVGEWVMAIGNPFGLDHTVTVGVLSGKGRVIGAGPYDDFLQTDASINPGNSGGPLFNLDGEVIGINTAIIAQGQGIGFAIPVNLARDIFNQLKSDGQVTRGFIGAGIQNLDPKLRRALNLPEGLKGALVSGVMPDGPAAEAGLQQGDVIVEFDGRPVTSDRELLRAVAATEVGKKARMVVQRGKSTQNLSVEVARRPDEVAAARPGAPADSSQLGLGVRELTPPLARQLGVDHGVVVERVLPGSPAARAGIESGDVIVEVAGQPVNTLEDLRNVLPGAGDEIALLIQRNKNSLFLVLER